MLLSKVPWGELYVVCFWMDWALVWSTCGWSKYLTTNTSLKADSESEFLLGELHHNKRTNRILKLWRSAFWCLFARLWGSYQHRPNPCRTKDEDMSRGGTRCSSLLTHISKWSAPRVSPNARSFGTYDRMWSRYFSLGSLMSATPGAKGALLTYYLR